jgi:hypothetical protein
VFDKIKGHVDKHKAAYWTGSIVIVAGITYYITRSNIGQRSMGGATGQRSVANTASFIFQNKQSIDITTVLAREGRGHPGWPVQNLETKQVFFSQKQAADAFGLNRSILSGHLKGKFPDANGLHFQRVNLIPQS